MKKQVLFARIREAYSPGFFNFILQPGEHHPIDMQQSVLSREDQFYLFRDDEMFGVASFPVPKEICTCVFKTITTEYEVGQIVYNKIHSVPFTIRQIGWSKIGFWLYDGFGATQNRFSGAFEKNVRIATQEEIEMHREYLNYYDGLMYRKANILSGAIIESSVNPPV